MLNVVLHRFHVMSGGLLSNFHIYISIVPIYCQPWLKFSLVKENALILKYFLSHSTFMFLSTCISKHLNALRSNNQVTGHYQVGLGHNHVIPIPSSRSSPSKFNRWHLFHSTIVI